VASASSGADSEKRKARFGQHIFTGFPLSAFSFPPSNVPARSRTWSTTFAESRASVTPQGHQIPHRGIEPRPTASKAAMRPPHPQGISSGERKAESQM